MGEGAAKAVGEQFMTDATSEKLKQLTEKGHELFMSPSTGVDEMWTFVKEFMDGAEQGSTDSEFRMLLVQRLMSLRTQFFGLLTNVLKAVDDTSQRIIGNIR